MRLMYLASYPKSGNTWLRFLLHSALVGPVQSSAELSRKFPDLHKPDLERATPVKYGSAIYDGPLLFGKTHFMPGPKIPGWERAAGAISIVRDPRDVLKSALHHRRITARGQQFTSASYAHAFIQHGGDPVWGQLGFGSIAEHTLAWQNCGLPLLTIRYEDLKKDTAGVLSHIIEFLKLENPPEKSVLENAVKGASLEAMRAMEIREKGEGNDSVFAGDPELASRGMYFVNRGLSGQRLDDLGTGFDQAFDARFGLYLRALGYARPLGIYEDRQKPKGI